MWKRSSYILAAKTFNAGSTTRAFMTFQVMEADSPLLRVEFELFSKKCPMATENFAKLCSGEAVLPYQAPSEAIADPGFKDQYAPQLHYQGTMLHRVIPDFLIQGGDVVNRDGTGNISVFGPSFDAPAELGVVPFDRVGLLGTATSTPHTNGSQFFILTAPSGKHLDGTCICFGRVSKGLKELMETVHRIPRDYDGTPATEVRCVECGIL